MFIGWQRKLAMWGGISIVFSFLLVVLQRVLPGTLAVRFNLPFSFIFLPLGILMLVASAFSTKSFLLLMEGGALVGFGIILYFFNYNVSPSSFIGGATILYVFYLVPAGLILMLMAVVKIGVVRYVNRKNAKIENKEEEKVN